LILLSLDFETTGLDVVNDRVIEFGAVLYSTAQHKCLDSQGMLVKTDKEITSHITGITGIYPQAVEKFGYDPENVLPIIMEMMESADYMIGYNVRRFDYYILYHWLHRAGLFMPPKVWIDLYADLPWTVPVGKLSHTAADHGILNLFPHSALADAQTVLALSAKYKDELLVERAKSPVVILRSLAERSANDVVKQFKFRWNPGRKWWWKPVKEQDVDEVVKTVPFGISIEKDVTFEELDN
jgi:DNA polymerase III epsilon subunit-like protein